MRKLFALLALFAVVAVLAPPVRATTILPVGEYSASETDRSNLFSEANDGDEFLEPEGLGDDVDVGDEQRSIFKVDALNTGFKVVEATTGTKTVVEDGGTIDYTSGLLTGMLYDLKIDRIIDQSDGSSGATITPPAAGTSHQYTLEKGRAGRYLSSGGSDGTWTDTIGGPGELVSDGPVNGVTYGGILVIYEDPALNLAFDGDGTAPDGPWDWREPGDVSGLSPHPGAAALSIPGVMTTADDSPTTSDVPGSSTGVADSGTAEPWLVAVLVDLADIPAHGPFPANPFGVADGTYLKEFDFTIDSGLSVDFHGLAFANIIGGTAAHVFDLGNFNVFSADGAVKWLADLRIEFEGESAGILYNGWQIDSDDPTMFGIIPEPATMTLLGLSLVGLAGLRRKKKS